ncbi:unnamed protein product [Rhizoctonia solani]|uniref:Uncharacterized protein n=1 Tax=Rhizoctonia solani TaxID=456999 RepID=A0A8H3CJ97_9AGAM|nr:unnamed protein product [Rhizoctonia solani]
MIHVAPKSVASDGTAATSPPFSPFSPATSVASDNTGTSDDHSTEPADLGAFQSVFRALSQLQISHPPRTMTSLATIPSIEEDDDDDDDDTDRNFNSDDDSDRWASAIDDEQEEDADVVTPSRDQHNRLGSDTEGASSRNTEDESSDEQVATAYTYDVESAVEAEDSRTIWNHEPIASYLVSAATPAPDRQAAKLRQLEYGARGGRGTYVNAHQMNEQSTSFTITHEALLNQTHALAQQTLMQPPVEPQTYSTEESSPAPYYTTSRRAASNLPPVYIPPTSNVPVNQHIPRTPGPGDPNLGALEQALEFLAAERTRVASQLDSSIEEYNYRTTEGKRRRRKRKKGVREEATVPPGVTLALARSTSNLHLNTIPVARSGNSNNSGSAHERTDTAVPSPSEGTSFSSSSADPRNVRRSYMHDATEIPPVPVLHQQQRRPSTGTAYSAGPGINPNMMAHEIIASYSVPTPPPTGRRGARRAHARGSSFEGQQAQHAGYPPRVPAYDPRNGPLVDPRVQSIGQRLSGGSGSGSSPTNMEQSGESKVARLRVLANNLANHFPEDAGALRRAAEGGGGTGFDRQENLLYVFVDHSNILVGFLEYLKKNPQLLPPSVGSPRRLKPKILHTALVLLLERGRPCARRILVASSPLHQTLDGVVGMGYEVSVLQRVEIKEGDGASPSPRPRRAGEIGSSEDDRNNPGAPSLSRTNSTPRKPTPNHRRTPSDNGRPRYREEAVDELLQLKLLQTILDTVPATIVLATGDGASSQFNPDGFVGCVRRAVDRGWMVELVGWEEGVSRAWKDLERDVAGRGPRAKGGFRIVGLERWVVLVVLSFCPSFTFTLLPENAMVAEVELSPWLLGGEQEQELEDEDASLLPPSERPTRQNGNKTRIQQLLAHYRGPSLREYYPQFTFLQHPWIPSHLSSLAFTLLISLIFVFSIISVVRWITREDKYQLPWRSYCTLEPEFPPAALALEFIPPVGLFIGVLSTAKGFQRRQLIRSTWASHPKSRGGVDGKSDLDGTSRTVVRFVVGAPSPSVERKLRLENELYGDIVVLPIRENMNEGKTYAYFSWAYEHALVPPQNPSSNATGANPQTNFPRHDPSSGAFSDWVKPDYIVKTDEDSFVMLAELEARLRVEHYKARMQAPTEDPLVYWGYLIKDYFMGGELYALSWPLVSFVATSETVKTMTIGYEDQQVAKWIGTHPHASRVRWASERCWMYNHPKSGNVYAHGFLFPSEVQRVKKSTAGNRTPEQILNMSLPTSWEIDSPEHSWSSVTGVSLRYTPPYPRNLTLAMEVEALVEGSALSQQLSPRRREEYERHVNGVTVEMPRNQKQRQTLQWGRIQAAYDLKEDSQTRYLGKNLGGTVLVHYVKKDEWFLETSLALLGDGTYR